MKNIVRRWVNENSNANSAPELDQRTLELFRDKIMRYFMRRLRSGDPQEGADLCQEVFIRLLQRKTSEGIRDPLRYVYGVAAKVFAAHCRKTGKGARFVCGEDAARIYEDIPSESLTDRLEEWASIQQQIMTVLQELPPMQAAVLVLHKRDGLSYEEVARRLDLSVNTVHKYVTEAKLKMRMHFCLK